MTTLVTPISGVLQTAGRRRQVTEISDGNYTIQETDHVISVVAPLLVPIRLPFEAVPGTTIEIADGAGMAFADPILISGNGQTINGSPSTSIATNYGRIIFTKGTANDWAGSFVDQASASAAEAAAETDAALVTAARTQAVWHVSFSTGSDTQDGLTLATAVQHLGEVERRLNLACEGGQMITPPPVAIPVPFPPFSLTLRPWTCTVHGNSPTSDPFGLQVTWGPDVLPQLVGASSVILSSGTLTGVVAAATPALKRSTNQRYELADVARGIAPWETRRQIRLVAPSPRAGAVATISEDLGANTCVTSDWNIPSSFPFPGGTEVTPVVGDPYVVEALTEIALKGDWQLYRSSSNLVSPGVVGFVAPPYLGFTNIKIVNTPNSVTLFTNLTAFFFNKCQINPFFYAFNCSFVLNATTLLNGANFSTGGLHFLRSGAVYDSGIPAGTAGSGGNTLGLTRELYVSEGAIVYADLDVMCYGGPEWHIGASASVFVGGFFAAFKSVAKVGHPSGFGMKVTPGCLVDLEKLPGGGTGSRFWGKDNQKKGIYIEPMCVVAWGSTPGVDLVPTVTGLSGVNPDFAMGLQTNEFSTTVDGSLAADVAGNVPVWLGKIPNLWTALDTPAAIAGVAFGGNAIDAVGGGRINRYPFIG